MLYGINTFVRLARFIANSLLGIGIGFVLGVLFARPPPQMIRIAARWIVAVVADVQCSRRFAVVQFVHQPMHSIPLGVSPKQTVAITVCMLLPNPATRLLVNLDPRTNLINNAHVQFSRKELDRSPGIHSARGYFHCFIICVTASPCSPSP